ncbi:unnamed protein product [Leptidea sinapis]|uniref:RRM domain-containing protein n=1 Tax=Leptidea sinapis TaxID=189913 RepID=A0A5E4QPW3_9NEOP|nr:unnamed protein product [Leptidea sinapis]
MALCWIAISAAVESSAETTVRVGVPYEDSTDYVRQLFGQCGEVAHIHEFSKTKYKILRVTFHEKESAEKALKLDRELRLNGFLVTVSKNRDEEEQMTHAQSNAKGNKRQHGGQNQDRNSGGGNTSTNNANNSYHGRGGSNYNARGGNFRGEIHIIIQP